MTYSLVSTVILLSFVGFSKQLTRLSYDVDAYGFLKSNTFYVWEYPCGSSPANTYQFCNTSLSFEERSQNYVSLLTDTDMAGLSGNNAETVDHLGISNYQWWSEALHGVANSPGVNYDNGPINATTMFPQVILTGASFNASLFNMIGNVVGIEGRAMFNEKEAGLTFWAPNINIFRDPRWGRGQETPGEDPFLNSIYAENFISGIQGTDETYLRASSCPKHFAGYSMENSDGYNRHDFNAIISDYDLNDTYFPAFKYGIVNGGASGLMCSYNAVNGVPSCANNYLLTELVRDTWGFNGYITSDCGAVSNVENNHHYTIDDGETNAAVFSAGMDSNCGGFTQSSALDALQSGELAKMDIQRAMYNLVMVQMRLGLFDPPDSLPFADLGVDDVITDYNLQLSLEASRQGMVLFKNDGILPLTQSDYTTVAIVGPNADNINSLRGNYAGTPPFYITPLQAIQTLYGSNNVMYEQGCTIDDNSTANFSDALNAVSHSDITFLVVGIDTSIEGEGHDRTYIDLPGVQNEFISDVIASSRGPVIMIVASGGCVDISQWQENSNVQAILWTGYSGMYGGEAMFDIIFGNFAPTGLTDQTWYYSSYLNDIEMIDMNMRPNEPTPGRGYRYFSGDVLYPFGYGLSYTTFSCTDPDYDDTNNQVTVTIKNTGNVDSGAAVLIYWTPTNSGMNGLPITRLVAFGRVNLLEQSDNQDLIMDLYPEFLLSGEMNNGGSFVLGGACNNN